MGQTLRRLILVGCAVLSGWAVSCGGGSSDADAGLNGGADGDADASSDGSVDVSVSGGLNGGFQGGLGKNTDGGSASLGGGFGGLAGADASVSARPTLTDGTVGSSCGTCSAGLMCISAVPGGYCTKACKTSADCGSGASCHDDDGLACFRDCTDDSQCRTGYSCILDKATNSKICYPTSTTGAGGATGTAGASGAAGATGAAGTTGSTGGITSTAGVTGTAGTTGTGGTTGGTRSTLSDGSVGSSCGSCATGLTCLSALPGGYCIKACNASSECGPGASCHNDNGLVCFRDCADDSQCRTGYSCILDQATNSKICYPNTINGAGGASGGSAALSDGSVGSSCGTCTAGLICLSGDQIPNGYCSKDCTSDADCGAGASCHIDGKARCMRNCTQDSECRSGYGCKLDPQTQTKICYPGGQSSGGTGNAALRGCYWRNRDITYRLYFDGVGTFKEPMWNAISGSIVYSGRYQVSGSQLILQYSDGTTKTYSLQSSGNSMYIIDGSATYAYAEATCS